MIVLKHHKEPRDLRVLSLFGTRPEAIKFAPVILELENRGFETVNINSAQHRDLLAPLIDHFGLRIDHNLEVMREAQSLNGIASRVLESLDPILETAQPDVVLVQGDTTTAMAGALAGWNRKIPVGHLEAGLRSGNPHSPFPEEMNRRLITRMATWHFAATQTNREILEREGVGGESIFVTGNPVIDALEWTLAKGRQSEGLTDLLETIGDRRLIVLTTHRRESFGESMEGNLEVIREFAEAHEDVAVVFPVHPNPAVREVAEAKLAGCDRILRIEPLPYADFLPLMSRAWLLVSDSGGLQEEAPTLGKPLIILRENTERPEAVACGAARLTGGSVERLRQELEAAWEDDSWAQSVARMRNPFGDGTTARQIADALLGPVPAEVAA